MRVTCKHCGGSHPAFECRKRSTAELMEVHHSVHGGTPDRTSGKQSGGGQGPGKPSVAGTQALPVDTNSVRAENEKVRPLISQAVGTTSLAGVEGNEDRQPKFDKKAWMREYMREYMRQRRQSIKSGTRIPKERG